MASSSDIRKGLCIKYNNDIYKIIEFLHVKPGKGPAFVRTKLKSVTNGKVIDNTFSAGHKIEDVRWQLGLCRLCLAGWLGLHGHRIEQGCLAAAFGRWPFPRRRDRG